MTYSQILVVGVAALALASLPVLVFLSLRISRAVRQLAHRPARLSEADFDALAQRMDNGDQEVLHSLRNRVEEMHQNFDWLVSDRMIEQAINMARSGQPSGSIAQETGISATELDAIKKYRRH